MSTMLWGDRNVWKLSDLYTYLKPSVLNTSNIPTSYWMYSFWHTIQEFSGGTAASIMWKYSPPWMHASLWPSVEQILPDFNRSKPQQARNNGRARAIYDNSLVMMSTPLNKQWTEGFFTKYGMVASGILRSPIVSGNSTPLYCGKTANSTDNILSETMLFKIEYFDEPSVVGTDPLRIDNCFKIKHDENRYLHMGKSGTTDCLQLNSPTQAIPVAGTYFGFVFDSRTNQIQGICPWSAPGLGPDHQLGTDRGGARLAEIENSRLITPTIKANEFDVDNRIILLIVQRSPYMVRMDAGDFDLGNCCINGNVDLVGQQICKDFGLFSIGSNEGPQCRAFMTQEYCKAIGKDGIPNLLTESCIQYCNSSIDSLTNCDSLYFNYCKLKKPTGSYTGGEGNVSTAIDNRVCGCFYDQIVYDGFQEEIRKYLPLGIPITADPTCFFPMCSSTRVRPHHVRIQAASSCPALNIVSCIQNVNFTNNGVMRDIVIDNRAECSINSTGTGTSTGTSTGTDTGTGTSDPELLIPDLPSTLFGLAQPIYLMIGGCVIIALFLLIIYVSKYSE